MSEEDFTKYETSYRQYYGSNYNKALRNLKNTKKRMEKQFVQQYPNARLDKVQVYRYLIQNRRCYRDEC